MVVIVYQCLKEKEKEQRMSVRIPDSEVFNKNETKREGEKGEHIGVRIYRILKKMY